MTGQGDLTEACPAATGRFRYRLAFREARAAVTGRTADGPRFVPALSERPGIDPQAPFRDRWAYDGSAP